MLLLVLPLLGFLGGAWLHGMEASWWGAGIGFALACAGCVAGGLALARASRHR